MNTEASEKTDQQSEHMQAAIAELEQALQKVKPATRLNVRHRMITLNVSCFEEPTFSVWNGEKWFYSSTLNGAITLADAYDHQASKREELEKAKQHVAKLQEELQ